MIGDLSYFFDLHYDFELTSYKPKVYEKNL